MGVQTHIVSAAIAVAFSGAIVIVERLSRRPADVADTSRVEVRVTLAAIHPQALEASGGGDPTTPHHDRARLLGLLLAVPAVADGQTRQAVVERLRPEIRDSIRRRPAARPDVDEILSTCLDHEGGVGELMAAIHSVAGDSLSARQALAALAHDWEVSHATRSLKARR